MNTRIDTAIQDAKRRAFNMAVSLDIFLFCLLCLGNVAYNGQTASAAAYIMWRDGKWQGRLLMPIIDWIFQFQPHHCEISYLAEKHRIVQ